MNNPAVLIVDDEEEVCDFIREELTNKDYICEVSFDAYDALNKLKDVNFDLALIDVKLPGMSGIDLLKTIADDYGTTAAVIISGVYEVDTVVEAMKLGALDYITKPFTVDNLNNRINNVLERKSQSQVSDTASTYDDAANAETTRSSVHRQLDAIAYGIEVEVDYFDFHSEIVTSRTVELARLLGLPEDEITKWESARKELYSDRSMKIRFQLREYEGI